MNKFIVTGNLTKDAELRYTTNEKAYSKFTIANNEGYGDNKKTNFFNCTLWGKGAENLNRFLVKGQKVLITGRVDINDYTDKEGISKKIIDINVDSFGGVELIGNKSQQETSNNDYSEGGMPAGFNGGYDGGDITPEDDGDLPF